MLNILEGHIEGRRRVGRPRRGWIDDIRDWIGPVGSGGINITYGDIKRSAEKREHWRNGEEGENTTCMKCIYCCLMAVGDSQKGNRCYYYIISIWLAI